MSFERDRADREESEKRIRRPPPRGRADYKTRGCPRCGAVFSAPASRIAHIHRMHDARCSRSTDAEREHFRRVGRWPKSRKETS